MNSKMLNRKGTQRCWEFSILFNASLLIGFLFLGTNLVSIYFLSATVVCWEIDVLCYGTKQFILHKNSPHFMTRSWKGDLERSLSFLDKDNGISNSDLTQWLIIERDAERIDKYDTQFKRVQASESEFVSEPWNYYSYLFY